MAVAEMYKSTLQLVLDDGVDELTGKPIYKTKSFNNVKTEATADQLYTIAQAFAGLQERPLYDIERKDSSEIRQA
ncbi:DUF1659 domain-containing protein [Virgibacillus dakarensis]|uniref:DUF1659 domain-containing protein n=1 Tax=Lentibacillus populi TaxID=1827502 RepID=A0A9W5TUR7_9BACI|nr:MULTISPECIES: DUF1659 domain-containing protein [Bacillaceae]MBT2216755.1 DUF1659 domain-containing protein [Virgibacillus dakarensis]MTW87081.1 DUF1659 domain-containing protein [Virgibacillus dakarensis]GGB32367.1 hypothetical protein GCM10011409_07210 [Lentibacillus populi]